MSRVIVFCEAREMSHSRASRLVHEPLDAESAVLEVDLRHAAIVQDRPLVRLVLARRRNPLRQLGRQGGLASKNFASSFASARPLTA